jgi:hypothetical protein
MKNNKDLKISVFLFIKYTMRTTIKMVATPIKNGKTQNIC